MHTFDYCSSMPNEVKDEDLYEVNDDWLQEQQTKFNYARYKKDEFYQEKIGKFRKFNKEVTKGVVDGSLKDKVYVVNLGKAYQLRLPSYPDYMKTSMKESPQLRDEPLPTFLSG